MGEPLPRVNESWLRLRVPSSRMNRSVRGGLLTLVAGAVLVTQTNAWGAWTPSRLA